MTDIAKLLAVAVLLAASTYLAVDTHPVRHAIVRTGSSGPTRVSPDPVTDERYDWQWPGTVFLAVLGVGLAARELLLLALRQRPQP